MGAEPQVIVCAEQKDRAASACTLLYCLHVDGRVSKL